MHTERNFANFMQVASLIGLSAIALLGINCSSNQSQVGNPPTKPIASVSVKKAEELANKYFEKQFGSCGGPGEAIDKGWCWAFPTKVGYAGTLGPLIMVDKFSGKVSSDPGTTGIPK